jgi:hypothetical protein
MRFSEAFSKDIKAQTTLDQMFQIYINKRKEQSKPLEKVEPLKDQNQQLMLGLVNKLRQKSTIDKQSLSNFFNKFKVDKAENNEIQPSISK